MATIGEHYKAQKTRPTRGRKDTKTTIEILEGTARSSSSKEQDDMDILRQFDLNWEYGPCTGITRMERWNRAERHHLNPPAIVKHLIEAHPDDEAYTLSVWHDYDI